MIRASLIRAFVIRASLSRSIRRGRLAGFLILAVPLMSAVLMSQQVAGGGASTAVVTFTLDFPHSNPAHYSIAVDAQNSHVSAV